jgi:hypothetical protein
VIHPSNVTRNRHYVCYIAWFRYDAVAVAIWSSPVAANRMHNADQIIELRRLAISDKAPKNTATRMLSVMARLIKKDFLDLSLLISYQDTESHTGTIYKAAGWTSTALSPGTSWTETRKRNTDQSTAPKLRWERRIRPELPPKTKIIKDIAKPISLFD